MTEQSGQLKQIAGLIQKLSYSDMKLLTHKLSERLTSHTPDDVAESLLIICEDILAPAEVSSIHSRNGEDRPVDRAAQRVYRG